jgi:hypothetical protein
MPLRSCPTYSKPIWRKASRPALYVGQLLKGIKRDDLSVQQPTKFELMVNLKTAKAARPPFATVELTAAFVSGMACGWCLRDIRHRAFSDGQKLGNYRELGREPARRIPNARSAAASCPIHRR